MNFFRRLPRLRNFETRHSSISPMRLERGPWQPCQSYSTPLSPGKFSGPSDLSDMLAELATGDGGVAG